MFSNKAKVQLCIHIFVVLILFRNLKSGKFYHSRSVTNIHKREAKKNRMRAHIPALNTIQMRNGKILYKIRLVYPHHFTTYL